MLTDVLGRGTLTERAKNHQPILSLQNSVHFVITGQFDNENRASFTL